MKRMALESDACNCQNSEVTKRSGDELMSVKFDRSSEVVRRWVSTLQSGTAKLPCESLLSLSTACCSDSMRNMRMHALELNHVVSQSLEIIYA